MKVRIVEGDLLDQHVDAIVNAWNRNIVPWWLLLPQGVSGAIKRRAGYLPFRELGYRPMPLGSARHTSAGNLSFSGIIHVAGIDGFWRASPMSIAESVRSAIEVAQQHRYASIAMPIIGAGSGGMTEHLAEAIILTTLAEYGAEPDIEVVVVRYRQSARLSGAP